MPFVLLCLLNPPVSQTLLQVIFLLCGENLQKLHLNLKYFDYHFLSNKFSFSLHLLYVPVNHHPGNLGLEDEIPHQGITEFPKTLSREQMESI